MSGSIDPYKILGVSPGASFEEVRRAYRRAATKYHPDAGGDAWVFQQIQQAFAMLKAQFEGNQQQASSNSAESSQTKPNTKSSFEDSAKTSKQTDPDSSESTNRSRTEHSHKRLLGLEDLLSISSFQLRDETSYFVLANFMDVVMTGILMRLHAVEANPIAAYVYHHSGFAGMIGLKIASVALVCVLAQLVAMHNRTKGRLLLIGGTLTVSAVVGYSMFLAHQIIHFS